MTDNDDRNHVTRRTLLKGTAATGAAAGLSGTAAGKYRELIQDLDVEEAMQESDAARNFALLGIVGGWIGIGPAEVDARSNPTLRLVEGEEHEIFWVNGDGNHHNFNIQNEQGEVVEATSVVTEQGETQRLSFTAEPGMEEYFCSPHPVQMRGQIELIDSLDAHELRVNVVEEGGGGLLADVAVTGEGIDGGINERFGRYASFSDVLARGQASGDRGISRFDTLDDGTYTVTAWTYGHERVSQQVTIDGSDEEITLTLPEVEPGDPVETYELTLRDDGWHGEVPEDIAGETNPTLAVVPDETYRVEWTNEASLDYPDREDRHGFDLPGHNFAVKRENGSTIKHTDFLTEQGEIQTVEFVAEENLGTYLDQTLLDAVGDIVVLGRGTREGSEDEPGQSDADGQAGGAETTTAQGDRSEPDG